MTEVAQDRFNYVYSCDLDVEIQIKIGTLEGQRERPGYQELINDPLLRYSGACQEQCSDLYVTCRVCADGKSLSLPTRTSYKSFTNRWNWNEWVTLPVKYSDLPHDALLALTIWDIYGPRQAIPVGGTTISLFGKKGMFRQGMFDLKIWPEVEADGQSPTTTPGKTSGKEDEMSRLARLSKKHRGGHMPKVDWLDRLTFREIHMINEKEKRGSNFLYLMIEFPQIHWDGQEFAVVYFEPRGDELYQYRTYADIVTVPDPEIGMENLVESKHHKLARSLRSGPSDKDLKPNAATRDQLNTIVGYPPTTTLTSEEQDLVWKFRFYLSSQKKALTKFLKSVNWNLPQETKQALDLLNKWSPMDIDDALELLSPTFTHPAVRKYAVQRLTQADDEELLLYLLQLVQALKYENFEEIKAAYEKEITQMKASVAPVTVEPERERTKSLTDTLVPGSEKQIQDPLTCDTYEASPPEEPPPPPEKEEEMDLATFLITRAVNNFKLANFLCWYLMVECDDQDSQTKDGHIREMYVSVLKRFSNSLNNGGIECRLRRASISGQQVFMEKLYKVVKIISRESGNRKKKIEKLQALLSDPDILKFNFLSFDPIPLPLDPDVKVKGIVADQAHLFASALMPCRFNFRTTDDQEYVTIFKYGDDLRQDQLILQIITLMDMLLRKENLDLKLTPYKVLATNCKNGFVQFIQATSVAEILDSHGTIHNFFRKYAPSENGAYGIAPEVIDNYIKSCAGYCVITYLLGVGDRHFDNLLLSKAGKLFHVDFGYILGRDPKPLPPPMKLSKEMVDAMGGTNSEHFTYFKKMCYTAFLALRRSANLILNLFSLMVDANVPDIALEPDKTVKKVQDKFRLDLSDEEAVHFMQNVIDVSVSATMAAILEQMHKFAQYLRK